MSVPWNGSGTTEARPPASSVPPAPHGGLGVIAPPGQFRAGFSEQFVTIASLAGQFGVSRLCRLAAPGMMKMELDFGSLGGCPRIRLFLP